jgi:hypothetical protein
MQMNHGRNHHDKKKKEGGCLQDIRASTAYNSLHIYNDEEKPYERKPDI